MTVSHQQHTRFLPIILGTDNNAYGVARNIHENYGVTSVCVGKTVLSFTANSRIIKHITDPRMDEPSVFVSTLMRVAHENPSIPKVLIPCGDGYSALLSQHKRELGEHFLFNIVDNSLQSQLENKLDFYRTCETHGLPYPSTFVISRDDVLGVSGDDVQATSRDDVQGTSDNTVSSSTSTTALNRVHLPFSYPAALKANDSIEYLDLHFDGKKKAYTIHSEDELNATLRAIYEAGYTGEMVAQDFIPGDASAMAVLNAYVDRGGKVRMMCFGQCVLDAILPAEIGNYHALYTADGTEVYPVYEKFLTEIGYTGFANFDLKFDERDGTYKVFEINLRQGRSSYYMAAGGCQYITYLIDDLLSSTGADARSGADVDTGACGDAVTTAAAGANTGTEIIGVTKTNASTDTAHETHTDATPHYHTQEGKLWLYVDPAVVKNYAPAAIRDRACAALKRGHVYTQWYSADRSIKRWISLMRLRASSVKSYLRHSK